MKLHNFKIKKKTTDKNKRLQPYNIKSMNINEHIRKLQNGNMKCVTQVLIIVKHIRLPQM